MKKVYYIKIYYKPKNIYEKKILFLLQSLSNIRRIKFFHHFLDQNGLETVKKMKKLQETRGYKYSGKPIITNNIEKGLVKINTGQNRSVLLIVIKADDRIKKEIDDLLNKFKHFFLSIKISTKYVEDVEIITPLNMRGGNDFLNLSFYISKIAIDLLKIKKNSDLKNMPMVFLGVSVIFDLEKKFKKKYIFKKIIHQYRLYLNKYFMFNENEMLSLNKASEKYVGILTKVDKCEFDFQNGVVYKYFINGIYDYFNKSNHLKRVENNNKKRQLSWQFFHWFNNSLNIHFAKEVLLVFVLMKYYESKKS
ncbi:MAG: hypothetical protein WC725_00490 [Patescibacteria group bacterium]|jgi:hypothetical protein